MNYQTFDLASDAEEFANELMADGSVYASIKEVAGGFRVEWKD